MPIMPDLPQAEMAVIEMTNAFRRGHKLAALQREPRLTAAARAYARFLVKTTLFSHEADGRRPVDRIKAAGYAPCRVAENLAWMRDTRGFSTRGLARKMVDGWIASPGHRKNMMLAHVTQIGVAIAKVRRQQKYVAVQLFGRPLSMRYSVRIENRAPHAVSYTFDEKIMRVQPRTLIRHTACEPADIVFKLNAGGLWSRGTTARFAARDGQIFQLSRGAAGRVKVDLETP